MTEALINTEAANLMEKVVIGGDLKSLTSAERLSFYKTICDSLGLNYWSRPFEYITLNGKLTLYARKDCTEQLRKKHEVSVTKMECEVTEGVYVVRSYMADKSGRTDISIGAVSIEGLKGEAKANALMKCETKSKRRGTLSICGLGMLDETEVETIPSAQPFMEKPVELPPRLSSPEFKTELETAELELAKKALRDLMAKDRFSTAQREVCEEWLNKPSNQDVKKIKAKMRAQQVWLDDVQAPQNPDADMPPAAEGQAF